MKKIDIKKLCCELGIRYEEDSRGFFTKLGYYGNTCIVAYENYTGDLNREYIRYLNDVEISIDGYPIFCSVSRIYNDDYNYRALKNELTSVIFRYKQMMTECKKKTINKDFE